MAEVVAAETAEEMLVVVKLMQLMAPG
uniref:Uncharacterized protein n=1 Tax=Rhizophora mucronata TaxID=61149 RepID=A0A2P2PM59_RHIMU